MRIDSIPGVSTTDAGALKNRRLVTLDDVWRLVGPNFGEGVQRAAQTTGEPGRRIVDLLAQGECVLPDDSKSLVQRRWLDIVLLAFSLLLAVLAVRAIGVMTGAPLGIGIPGEVIVARHDLESGHALIRATDLRLVRIASNSKYVKPSDLPDGAILVRDVPRGAPLRGADVQRLQVIATHDIPMGQRIDRSAVTLAWSAYQPLAALQLDAVVGHTAVLPVHSGSTLVQALVSQAGAPPGEPSLELLSIPVSSTALASSLTPGMKVSLMFVSRDLSKTGQTESPYTLKDVSVRAVEQKTGAVSLVIALSSTDRVSIAPYLENFDVFVTEPER